jgi:hypothetical protein
MSVSFRGAGGSQSSCHLSRTSKPCRTPVRASRRTAGVKTQTEFTRFAIFWVVQDLFAAAEGTQSVSGPTR